MVNCITRCRMRCGFQILKLDIEPEDEEGKEKGTGD